MHHRFGTGSGTGFASLSRTFPAPLNRFTGGPMKYTPWRLVVAVISLITAAAGIVAVPSASAAPLACGSTNAALNRPVTASSTENAGTPASAAVDGNTGTRWSSAFSDPQSLQVDLGSSQSICQVQLNWEAAYANAFQVQTSADGNAWSTVYSTTTGAGGTQTLDVAGTGRYVRVNGPARATGYGDSLWELAVRTTTTGGGGTGAGISRFKPVAASSWEGGNAPAAALDG